jgi:hypothetical protein
MWIWLAVSWHPFTHTTAAARAALSKWTKSKLEEGYVPCLKRKSESTSQSGGGYNGYPFYMLPLVRFMSKKKKNISIDEWEVTFTPIRSNLPHLDAVPMKGTVTRDGASLGCDQFVRNELKRRASRRTGEVRRLGAVKEHPRQFQLLVHRAVLAELLVVSSRKSGRAYAKTTIMRSLSKLALSPRGPSSVSAAPIARRSAEKR